MTATQYFTAPKLQVQKANFEKSILQTTKKVLVKDFIAKNPQIKEQECHRLNHIIVTFLSREIADSLDVFAKRKLISNKDTKYFEKLANADNDFIENGYRKSNQMESYGKDFMMVIEVFNNLVSNAIKYNKMGGEIDISLRNKILTIKDTGIGIQEEKVKNIFDRYYRATSEQGGFGIGLNIVSKICKDYNIKIVVDSELNESTTFKLIF